MEMSQSVKQLLHKHKELSLDPQKQHETLLPHSTFFSAEIKTTYSKKSRVHFGAQFQVISYHVVKSLQKERTSAFTHVILFCFVLFYIVYHPSPNDGTLIVILPNTMNLIKTTTHRHTQNATLQVTPDLIPLTN